jgi:hypothetical protein
MPRGLVSGVLPYCDFEYPSATPVCRLAIQQNAGARIEKLASRPMMPSRTLPRRHLMRIRSKATARSTDLPTVRGFCASCRHSCRLIVVRSLGGQNRCASDDFVISPPADLRCP